MKDLFMKIVQDNYDSFEQYTKEMNELSAKQWVHQEQQCPNCNNQSLFKDEHMDIVCDVCAQNYTEVSGVLRFK